MAAELLGMREATVAVVEGSHNRHLHLYEKVAPTPACYPRRPGMARKRPLGERLRQVGGELVQVPNQEESLFDVELTL